MVTLTCDHCGETFEVKNHRKDTARFCSKACYTEAQRFTAPPRETIERLYVKQGLTQPEVAKRLGVSAWMVGKWRKKYRIPRHPRGFTQKIPEPSRDELVRLYYGECMTTREIAEHYGTSKHPVLDWMEEYDIKRRPGGAGRRERYNEIPPPDVLRILYLEWQLTQEYIGKLYGVTGGAVYRWMREYDIPARSDTFNRYASVIARDGTLVKSLYEMHTANWLHEHGVGYIYEPSTPFKGHYLADFLTETGWYIEVWGIKGHPKYDRNRKRKERLYERHNVPLLGLKPHRFDPPGRYRNDLKVVLESPSRQLNLFY